jgi:hypothetical protein
MKKLLIPIYLIFAIVVIILPITAAADANVSPTQSHNQTVETQVKLSIAPNQTSRISSGEVEVPITPRVTQTPEIPRTTLSAIRTETPTTIPTIPTTVSATVTVPQTTASPTQTVSLTTAPVTQTSAVPVVTVTVLVYPSGSVYIPVYNYPYGYSYPVDYTNPAGSLTVTSNPSEAIVILDGYNTETTPYIFTGLTTGYHTVEVDYQGYEAYVNNVYVDTGSSQEINANLVSLVSSGSLFVDSTPRGADVYVDGNYQGNSPVTVGSLSSGAHQVELHLAGYEVLTSTENVASGQGNNINLALIPLSSSSDSGSIDITSSQPGALVYLDGIYKGTTQSGNIFNIIAVSPGSHTIILHLPGYTDFTQTLQVNAGQIANVNAVFTPSPAVQQGPATASPATGSLIVTSSPAGGQISVDNQFRGVAPVTIYNIASGPHVINIQLTGYSDWSTSVNVPANQIVQVPATLVPISGSLPAPTRAGLSLVPIIGALAVGAFVLSLRARR